MIETCGSESTEDSDSESRLERRLFDGRDFEAPSLVRLEFRGLVLVNRLRERGRDFYL